MTDSPSLIVAGIDVGKSKLDACILAGERERRFDNTRPGRRALRNRLLRHRVERVVFEPAGRYHRNLHQGLCDTVLETVLVNPLRSRRFAEAVGVLAGNDRVDAAMLARFGLVAGLEGTPPRPRNLLLLGDLLALRGKLVEQLAALRKLRDELDPGLAAGAGPALDGLRAASATCDRRMRDWIAADAELARRAALIASVPGCDPVHAACLYAKMPVRGGRSQPRCLLYMAALSAIRCEPRSRVCYEPCALAASRPRSPWSLSCAGSRPGSARTVSGSSRPPPAPRRRPRDRRAARRRNSAPAAFSYAPELDTGHGSLGLQQRVSEPFQRENGFRAAPLQAARRTDPRQRPHQHTQVAGARIHQQSLRNVAVPPQVHPPLRGRPAVVALVRRHRLRHRCQRRPQRRRVPWTRRLYDSHQHPALQVNAMLGFKCA